MSRPARPSHTSHTSHTSRPSPGVLAAVALAAAVAAAPAVAPAQVVTNGYQVSLLGEYLIPFGATFGGTEVGGLSGIDYDPLTGRYYAISDDRGNDRAGSGPARFYTLDIGVTTGGITGVSVLGVTTFLQPDGTPYPQGTVDPESIRRAPDGTFYYASEGRRTSSLRVDPFVRQAAPNGAFLREFELRDYFRTTPLSNDATGVPDNFGFESLAFSPDGQRLYVAVENALLQDGPRATPTQGAPVRFVEYDVSTGQALREFVYMIDPAEDLPSPPTAPVFSGLVELLAFDDGRFLAMERSLSLGVGRHEIELYLTSIGGATNVLGRPSLVGTSYVPMGKSLFLDLDDFGPYQVPLTNIEGVTFGPQLANGDRTLIVVGDNNFTPGVPTQFLAFRLTAVPEPATLGLVLVGLLAVAAASAARRPRAG